MLLLKICFLLTYFLIINTKDKGYKQCKNLDENIYQNSSLLKSYFQKHIRKFFFVFTYNILPFENLLNENKHLKKYRLKGMKSMVFFVKKWLEKKLRSTYLVKMLFRVNVLYLKMSELKISSEATLPSPLQNIYRCVHISNSSQKVFFYSRSQEFQSNYS